MRRCLLGLATSLVLVLGAWQSAHAGQRSCVGWTMRVTRHLATEVRERRQKRLIRCVFAENGLAGQASYAIVIAERESGLFHRAYNPSSGASGTFQHLKRFWPGRARALPAREFPRWPNSRVMNARANAWAAAQLVRQQGWSPWSTS